MSSAINRVEIVLPDWLPGFIDDWPEPLSTAEQRMSLAIALSAENIRLGSGGPFGAIIVDADSSELLGAGVNLVTELNLSIAHAEMVAFSMAQAKLGDWNLGQQRNVQLVTSCEPCAMCYGAVPWSGVSSVLCGAEKAHAEQAGFDEGDKPELWAQALEQRGIAVQRGVLTEQAAAVLADYARQAGAIYNPGKGA